MMNEFDGVPTKDEQASASLRDRILTVIDELSPRRRQMAQYFLDHTDYLAFKTAQEVGEAVDASAATVVRFCRLLGYGGYADLQLRVRAKIIPNRTASQKLEERINSDGFSQDIAARIAEINTYNIHETLKHVAHDVLNDSVEALLKARQIRIFGSGMSAAAAVMAGHSLWMLGMPARSVTNGGLNQTIEIDSLTDQDVVIVISIWRYLRESVEALYHANALGATTIALTDSPISPAARDADFVFVAATERAAHSRSMTGILSLIDLINATIISKRPKASMDSLKRIDDSYQQHGRLLED